MRALGYRYFAAVERVIIKLEAIANKYTCTLVTRLVLFSIILQENLGRGLVEKRAREQLYELHQPRAVVVVRVVERTKELQLQPRRHNCLVTYTAGWLVLVM